MLKLVKIWLIILIHLSSLIIMSQAVRSPIYAPLHIISLKDITPEERRQIAFLEQKLERAKRSGSGSSGSGSGELLNALKSAIGNSIKKKIGQITMASASASGAFSKSSSSSDSGHKPDYYHHHHPPPDISYEDHDHHSHKSFDFWDLKKSVLNTLLQAVKAIKGGVIAVKGQLIKGGGKLVSASGSLVSSQGDAITHLGKQIATSAILVPWMGSAGKGHPHVEYESVDNHYPSPTGPEEIYHHAPPSGPSSEYHVPEHYPPPHREGAAGLLIVKKLPGHGHHDHHPSYTDHHDHHDHHYAPSTHIIQEASPSFGDVSDPVKYYESFDPYFDK